MQLGVRFRNGMRVALDLGPEVNARSIGALIRFAGARAARRIRNGADEAARRTTERMKARQANTK